MDEKKLRIQFELTPKAAGELEELRRMAEATTRAEVIRDALRLYMWYLEQVENGADVIVRKGAEETLIQHVR